MVSKRTVLLVLFFFVPLVLIFSQCFNLEKHEDARGEMYAGSASCVKCHKDIYNTYLQTAHQYNKTVLIATCRPNHPMLLWYKLQAKAQPFLIWYEHIILPFIQRNLKKYWHF